MAHLPPGDRRRMPCVRLPELAPDRAARPAAEGLDAQVALGGARAHRSAARRGDGLARPEPCRRESRAPPASLAHPRPADAPAGRAGEFARAGGAGRAIAGGWSVSGTGGADIVHGAGLPSPRWWRRYRDIPLVVLTVLSLIAAVVGWVTQYRLDAAGAQPAAVAPSPGAEEDEAAAACRPAMPAPASQPWIEDSGPADATWQA